MLFVTGITGHSGTHFLRELVANDYLGEIRCLVRSSSNTTLLDNCGLKIDKVIGDLRDREFMNTAMRGADTVLHIGSIFHSRNVFKAAVDHHVKRTILVHTTGIYSQFKSASQTYKEIESDIRSIMEAGGSNIGVVYLRPTMIFGRISDNNMIIFIKMVDRLRLLPVINHGNGLLQPVSGKDLGKAYYQLLTRTEIMNGDYVLSGEKPLTVLEVFQSISRHLGKKTVFLSVPSLVGVAIARTLKALSVGRVDCVERVQRMSEDRDFPHDDAKRDFGYAPMSFDEGLGIEVEEYLKSRGRSIDR